MLKNTLTLTAGLALATSLAWAPATQAAPPAGLVPLCACGCAVKEKEGDKETKEKKEEPKKSSVTPPTALGEGCPAGCKGKKEQDKEEAA